GSDAGVRRWAPLFDRYGVDLVINGHNHCYERTHPVRAEAPVAEVASGGTWASTGGVTYLCAGGGGGQTFPMSVAPLSTVTVEGGARIPERAPWSAFRYNDHSLLLIDVEPPGAGGATTLTVRAVSAAGAEFDRLTLLRRRDRAAGAEPPAAGRPAA
ncbi:MAG TPA: phosphoesterase, partial [Acidimicrobiia bacterium]|nr:phosphoesterase [Acidimicrobiia bacterium]